MSVASRATVRAAVGAALSSTLTSAQAVYTDQPAAFGGLSPVVVVASAGSMREGAPRRTFGGPIAPQFHLDVYVFVATAIRDGSGDIVVNSDVDDQLDAIEAAVAQVVAAYSSPAWSAISYDDRTTTEFVTVIDGTEYKRETIPLVLTSSP
jgi:hypothetical protein